MLGSWPLFGGLGLRGKRSWNDSTSRRSLVTPLPNISNWQHSPASRLCISTSFPLQIAWNPVYPPLPILLLLNRLVEPLLGHLAGQKPSSDLQKPSSDIYCNRYSNRCYIIQSWEPLLGRSTYWLVARKSIWIHYQQRSNSIHLQALRQTGIATATPLAKSSDWSQSY